jgi:hypothetical protein
MAWHKHLVIEHQQLCVEDRRHLRPPPERHTAADVRQLLSGPLAAGVEALQLMIEPGRRHVIAKDLFPLDEDDGPARYDARRDANPR